MASVFKTQGIVPISGVILYGANPGYQSDVENIKFVNTNNDGFVIKLFIYRKSSNTKVLAYRESRNADEIVNDKTHYVLRDGDYLWGEAEDSNVVYNIAKVSQSKIEQ